MYYENDSALKPWSSDTDFVGKSFYVSGVYSYHDTTSGNSTSNTEQTAAQKTKALKTGDESPVGYLLVLLVLCGAAVVFTGKKGYLK